jgi:hypothetical protein
VRTATTPTAFASCGSASSPVRIRSGARMTRYIPPQIGLPSGPDGAGVASVAEGHTRGTGVLRLSMTHRLEPGGSGPEATRTRLPDHGGGVLPGGSAGLRGGRGDVLRGSHGDVAGVESGASSVERSSSEPGNRPWSARGSRGQRGTAGWAHRRPADLGWGGVVAVVRGRESRSHGEGRQRCQVGTGGCNAEGCATGTATP